MAENKTTITSDEQTEVSVGELYPEKRTKFDNESKETSTLGNFQFSFFAILI